MMKRAFAILLGVLAIPAASLAQTAPSPAHLKPLIEFAIGVNGPQYRTAEFPGFSLAVAGNVYQSRNWGASVVGEADASYVRRSRAIGGRLFARTSGLESGSLGTTAWVQVLAGRMDGMREGIIVSNGGHVTQPGVGLAIGSSGKSFVVQIDRQNVAGGLIHDDKSGETVEMSRTRITVGVVRRF